MIMNEIDLNTIYEDASLIWAAKVSSIAAMSKTQNQAMSVVRSGLEQIDSVAKNNLDTVQRTATATEQLDAMTRNLSEIIKQIRKEKSI